ncbi:tetratricopeptide repeat protein [Aneurinibacillus terranovensis]|uniref:tetratricopeptide repeat protein n=1 Tax=Aneurinibacillus terranovensis TaxID=278991 RepID=UPI00040D64F2|nr:tetratricopeptide repeat protein [Aneurinibacillus terranovensis]
MLSHFFAALNERLLQIQTKLAGNKQKEKQKYYNEIMELRALSDCFVEEWLAFEEKLIDLQRMMEREWESSAGSSKGSSHGHGAGLSAINQAEVSPSVIDADGGFASESEAAIPLPVAMNFRKGQGYFALSMYDEAVKSFSAVIEHEPDLTIARLYLAFGFLMSNHLEVAYKQFQLLVKTSNHPLIKAASLNALGCISVLESRTDLGLKWFDRALEQYPEFQDAAFNRMLTLYHAGEYNACVQAVCSIRDADADLEIQFLLFSAFLKSGRKKEAKECLRRARRIASQQEGTPRDWQVIAHGYEQLYLFKEAAFCYRRLLPDLRKEAWVWHGIGWSLWQQKKEADAVPYLKRALALEPHNAEYACSYGWAMLGLGETEKAYQIFSLIDLQKKGTHEAVLAVAGMIEALLQNPEIGEGLTEAETLTRRMLYDARPNTRALGHFQLGKICMVQEDKDGAMHHFSLSESLIREGALYTGLLHYMKGNRLKAYDKWEMTPPIL